MTANAMIRPPNVVFVDRECEASLIDGLKQNGWQIIKLKGGTNIESFFIAARDTLPLDYPISGGISWDALDDSLSGGLIDLNAEFVAILWMDADQLLCKDPASFSMCQQLLSGVEYDLEHERKAGRTNAHLRSFLLGKGSQFPRLEVINL